MTNVEAVTKAIGTHGNWKSRLASAIETGKCTVTVATARADCECEFGKWLISLPAADAVDPEVKQAKTLHTRFHQEAGKVLDLALNGKKDEAHKSMSMGGPYAQASANLTSHMMGWRKKLGA